MPDLPEQVYRRRTLREMVTVLNDDGFKTPEVPKEEMIEMEKLSKAEQTDIKELTERAKSLALTEGADLVGVASVYRFKGAPTGFHPRDLMKGTQSIVVIARRFLYGILDELTPEKQRFTYKHHMYNHLNRLNSETMYRVAKFLEKRGYRAYVVQPTTPYYSHEFYGVLSHRHAAVRAGLGIFGKSNLVLTKQFGTRQRFCTLLTDARMASDPIIKENLCNSCYECRKVCPVQAWDPESGRFYKPLCAHYQMWNRADQECKQPCGLCVQACPVGKGKR